MKRHDHLKVRDTPLIVELPKAGLHLYYKSSGEPNADLRAGPLAMNRDVRGDGGLITAPPTIRAYGSHRGRPDRVIRGDLADLQRLPPVKTGVLDFLRTKAPASDARICPPPSETSPRRAGMAYPEDALFQHLRRHMRRVDLDGLIAIGRAFVSDHGLDVPAAKIISTARRVKEWAEVNPDWTGGPGHPAFDNRIIDDLANARRPLRPVHGTPTSALAFPRRICRFPEGDGV